MVSMVPITLQEIPFNILLACDSVIFFAMTFSHIGGQRYATWFNKKDYLRRMHYLQKKI